MSAHRVGTHYDLSTLCDPPENWGLFREIGEEICSRTALHVRITNLSRVFCGRERVVYLYLIHLHILYNSSYISFIYDLFGKKNIALGPVAVCIHNSRYHKIIILIYIYYYTNQAWRCNFSIFKFFKFYCTWFFFNHVR